MGDGGVNFFASGVLSPHFQTRSAAHDAICVKQHRVTIVDFHRQTREVARRSCTNLCAKNEFLGLNVSTAERSRRSLTVKHIAHEINAADHLMSNVRIATIECKSVDAIPDTLRWSFDGLTGVALLFIKGRPPRCHRCGARDHKVAECTSLRTYASTMRGDTDVDGEDYDDDNEEATDTSLATDSGICCEQPGSATCGSTDGNGDRGRCGRRSGCDIGETGGGGGDGGRTDGERAER